MVITRSWEINDEAGTEVPGSPSQADDLVVLGPFQEGVIRSMKHDQSAPGLEVADVPAGAALSEWPNSAIAKVSLAALDKVPAVEPAAEDRL
jgi:hypothetical protein